MIFIGCHLSISDGYEAMGKTMTQLGGSTFAFFTRNPRGGKAKPIRPDDAAALRTYHKQHSFGPLVAHAPYTMNLCSENSSVREYAEECFSQDIQKMELFPGNSLVKEWMHDD